MEEEQKLLRNCMKMGKRNRGLFRLTVPTGGGKTIASLGICTKSCCETSYGSDYLC